MDLAGAFALGVFAASNDTIRPLALAVVPMIGFIWYEARRAADEFCKVRPKPAPAPIKSFRRPVAPTAQDVVPTPPVEKGSERNVAEDVDVDTSCLEKAIDENLKNVDEALPNTIRQELLESKKDGDRIDRWLDEGKDDSAL